MDTAFLVGSNRTRRIFRQQTLGSCQNVEKMLKYNNLDFEKDESRRRRDGYFYR